MQTSSINHPYPFKTNIPMGLSHAGVARARGLCLVPALDVPQDWRQLCFPARFLFAGRRERLISVMGKAAALGHLWKGTALAVAPIRPAVALKVTGKVRGDCGCSGQGSPSADNSLSKRHTHHCHFPWQRDPQHTDSGTLWNCSKFYYNFFPLGEHFHWGRAATLPTAPPPPAASHGKEGFCLILLCFVLFDWMEPLIPTG